MDVRLSRDSQVCVQPCLDHCSHTDVPAVSSAKLASPSPTAKMSGDTISSRLSAGSPIWIDIPEQGPTVVGILTFGPPVVASNLTEDSDAPPYTGGTGLLSMHMHAHDR